MSNDRDQGARMEDVRSKVDELRFQRGYRAGFAGRAPSESWQAYLLGYEQGKQQARPGARWAELAEEPA